jgi:hypothetical protein
MIVALVLGGSIPALAGPAFVNGITVPADTLDLSGDPIALNQRLGMSSDLYYDPNRNQWWGLSDRGAGGGTLGTFANCFSINADGTLGNAFAGSTTGFNLIPGLLYAFKSTDSDLASFVAPSAVPFPATWLMLLAGLALVTLVARQRHKT